MATVHPSRMALVPQDSKDTYPDRDRRRVRSRSPRERRNRSRSRDRDDRRERRRNSPAYDDYKRPSPPPPSREQDAKAPWRQTENMYPNRRDRGAPLQGGNWGFRGGGWGGESGGTEFLESRRKQREAGTLSIWPPSPKAPARDLSPTGDHKSRKKSKRRRSPSTSSDSSDSEAERRRRERKEKRRARKEKEREKERRDKHRSKRSYDSEDETERDRRSRKRTRSRSESKRSPSRSRTPEHPPRSEDEENEWIEKPAEAAPFVDLAAPNKPKPTFIKQTTRMDDGHSDDDDVGPQPVQKLTAKKVDERSYGGALLRGEGSAMAAFLAEDSEARIPRRGEIGLTSDEIAKFEDVGYVMSGSRHRRMNAVRMRKENQVISAEEKRGILKLQKEERERREAILREEFGELVKEKLSGQEKRK